MNPSSPNPPPPVAQGFTPVNGGPALSPQVPILAPDSDLPAKVSAINDILRHLYGSHRPRSSHHPTDCLIATILSQHTADRNSSAAFAQLQQRYGTWEEIICADAEELAETIRPAGLANIKARRIQQTLCEIGHRYGTMDIAFLKDIPLQEARAELLSLPGVGPKTAACVLLFSCGLPALPVDTHVHRVARRLGLIGPRVSAEQAHAELEALVPAEDVYDFHVNLIAHGRQVCHARDPKCGACALQRWCLYFRTETA